MMRLFVMLLSLQIMLSISGCESSMCDNQVLQEILSQDKKLKAVVFQRDCGATTGFSTQVSVIKADEKLQNKKGNVFSADTNHGKVPAGPGGGPQVDVAWVGLHDLEVRHPQRARIFLSADRIAVSTALFKSDSISVKYRPMKSKLSNLKWLNNTAWEFPGGDMEPSKIIFRPDGHLVFEGGFASLNPSYWQYDEIVQELYFIIPNVTDEMLIGRIKRGRGQVKRVDQINRSLIYDFYPKTEVFDFMGWNYFKKSDYYRNDSKLTSGSRPTRKRRASHPRVLPLASRGEESRR